MTITSSSTARAVANFAEGHVLASVEIAAPPERVFKALASKEIVNWWVRPGVFDTTEWTGDVRKGGRWRASGTVRGEAQITGPNHRSMGSGPATCRQVTKTCSSAGRELRLPAFTGELR